MRKLKEHSTRHTHIQGLFISPDGGTWNTTPVKGLVWKTREEILGGSEASASESSQPQNEESKQKKQKKQK